MFAKKVSSLIKGGTLKRGEDDFLFFFFHYLGGVKLFQVVGGGEGSYFLLTFSRIELNLRIWF
jgi:hypothetical protein